MGRRKKCALYRGSGRSVRQTRDRGVKREREVGQMGHPVWKDGRSGVVRAVRVSEIPRGFLLPSYGSRPVRFYEAVRWNQNQNARRIFRPRLHACAIGR